MTTGVLIIHVLLAVALVGVILVQRSEGGALGGLGGGTFGGLMTGRGTANLLTRTTAILAACFLGTSLALALLAGHGGRAPSILDLPAQPPAATTQGTPAPGTPAPGTPATPAQPAKPAAPAAPAGPTAPVAQ
jgi:preprotein translocase subunit SecG